MDHRPKIIDAEFEVISGPDAPSPYNHRTDPNWLALPWWRKYKLVFAPGTWVLALMGAAMAIAHSVGSIGR